MLTCYKVLRELSESVLMMKHWSTVTSSHNAGWGKFHLGKMWGCELDQITGKFRGLGSSHQLHILEFILLFDFSIFSESGTSQKYQLPLEFFSIVLWGLANEIEILRMEATECYLQGIRLST